MKSFFIFIGLLITIESVSAQSGFSKLIGRNNIGESARGVLLLEDSSALIQVRSALDGFNFTYGWIHLDRNGDSLSTFLYETPFLRDDGLNSVIVKSDTIFQLIKHRDSVSHIRIQASSLSGDSLFRWDYDWNRSNWKIIYAPILHRTIENDFLIVGTVKKVAQRKWDIFAMLIGADGNEKWRKVIVEDYTPLDTRVDFLLAFFIVETDQAYYLSTKNMSGRTSSSGDIFKLDKNAEVQNRFVITSDAFNDDFNPIALTSDQLHLYYANSRVIQPTDTAGYGLQMHEITNPNMTVGMIDTSGNLIWDRPVVLPDGNWLAAFNAKTVQNGDFVVCGGWQIENDYHGFIARYNVHGDLLWRYVLPQNFSHGRDVLWMIDFVEYGNGDLLFVGDQEDFTTNFPYNLDVWLLKIPGAGCQPPLFCNGDTLLSNIKLIPDSNENHPEFTLYPNPVFPGQELNLDINPKITGVLTLRWADIQGRTVHIEKLETLTSTNVAVPSNLKAGFYFLKVTDRFGKTASAKVVVWEAK